VTFKNDVNNSSFGQPTDSLLPVFSLNTAAAADKGDLTPNVYISDQITAFCIVTPRRAHTSGKETVVVGKWNGVAANDEWALGMNQFATTTDYKPWFQISIGSTRYGIQDANTWAQNERLTLCGVRASAFMGLYREGILVASITNAGTGQINNVFSGIRFGEYTFDTSGLTQADYELFLLFDVALNPDQVAYLSANPYCLYEDSDETDYDAAGLAPHNFFPTQSVTDTVTFSQSATVPTVAEGQISATMTRIALGGRMTTRIGSRLYTVAVDSSKTWVLYSDDDGGTWTPEQVINSVAFAAAITQGASSQPVLALVKPSESKIRFYTRGASGGWTYQTYIGTGATAAVQSLAILYDNTNYHVLYAARASSDDSRNVYYRKTTNIASWPSATILDNGDNSGTGAEQDRALAAALGPNGNIHLAYCQNKSNRFYLRYMKNTAGTWGAVEQLEDLGVDTASTNRCIQLSLSVDNNSIPYVYGVKWYTGTKQVVAYNKLTGSWVAQGRVAAVSADQQWPSAGFQSLTVPNVVFEGTISSTTVQYGEYRNGLWAVEGMSFDGTMPDQCYDPFRSAAQTLEGSVTLLKSSLSIVVTTSIVWGNEPASYGGAAFSQVIQVKGRDKVNHGLAFSQSVVNTKAYSPTVTHNQAFTHTVQFARNMPRSPTQGAVFTQDISMGYFPTGGGGNTFFKQVSDQLHFDSLVPLASKVRVKTVTHTVNFQQVGPGLTQFKEVVSEIEFTDDVAGGGIRSKTETDNLGFTSIVSLNKILNKTVTHALTFGQSPTRIRDWVWNSTHFNPGWAAEYESDVQVFVIMGPDSLPTVSMTLPKPDFGDENVIFRRPQAVRRTRSGKARTFVVPVYQKFKYVFPGLMRKRAEEFRQTCIPLLGKVVRIIDHNGVTTRCIITDVELPSVQVQPEQCVVTVHFEKADALA
jgi:hypothetical protein